MASQEPPAQPSTWSKTKGGFQVVGKGAGAARTGINSGLSKLDNMSVSKKGLSFKKELSGQNVSYDRENHVSRPKVDVSHLPPPPRRIPGQAPPPKSTASSSLSSSASRPVTTTSTLTRPAAPSPAPRPSPPIPQAPRPAGSRAVPLPPPAAPKPVSGTTEEPLPVYTPTNHAAPAAQTGMMGDLSARMNKLRASPAPAAPPKPSASSASNSASNSSIPSMNEAKTAFGSAKTVGGLYGKYGNQQPGQKTATPSWSEVKAGAAAAQNLHAFHGKYAPKETVAAPATTMTTTTTTTTTTPQFQHQQQPRQPSIVAPKPVVGHALATGNTSAAAAPIPSPKPPLPKGKPGVRKEYCIGLYAFDAEAPGDLGFQVGDQIEVLERTSDPEAWWKGRLNGVEGIFPGNYCRLETV